MLLCDWQRNGPVYTSITTKALERSYTMMAFSSIIMLWDHRHANQNVFMWHAAVTQLCSIL